MKRMKQVISLVLCGVMLLSYIPVPAFAQTDEEPTEHQHSWDGGTITAPTCTAEGFTTYTCTTCGESYVDDATSMLEHSWGEGAVTAPTCDAAGFTTYACTVCDSTKQEDVVAAPGHSWGEGVVTAPKCDTAGYTTVTCTVCNGTERRDEVAAPGHSWDNGVVTAPKCDATGYTTVTCTVCNGTERRDEVAAPGHSWDNGVVTAPKCDAAGYTTFTCTVCNGTERRDEVAALGHKWGDWTEVQAPTALAEGKKERTCATCSEKETESIEKLPPVLASSVTVSQTQGYTEILLTDEMQLTAVVLPEDTTDKTIIWSSSDETIATVDETGLVTGVALGEVTITAACGEVKGNYALSVVMPKNATYATVGGACGTGVNWTMDTVTGILKIYGSGAMNDYGAYGTISKVPWCGYDVKYLIVEEGVTQIGATAFDGNTSLETVSLAESVTGIGIAAFRGCTALESVNLDGVKSINTGAFEGCSALTSVALSSSLTNIEIDTFNGCSSLQYITLPSNLVEIKNSAFEDCTSLAYIVVPEGVKYIYSHAFMGCSKLASVTLPASLKGIGTDAFANCNNIKEVYISSLENWCGLDFSDFSSEKSNPMYYGAKLYINYQPVTDLVIPEGLDISKSYNFTGCGSIKSITISSIPGGINYAFQNCTGIKEIHFLGGFPSFITEEAFKGITATVYYPAADTSWEGKTDNYGGTLTWVPVYNKLAEGTCGTGITWEFYDSGKLILAGTGRMPDYAATNQPWTEYADEIMEVAVAEGITAIGSYAFYNCTNLEKVTGGTGITAVYDYAFYGCEKLTSISGANLGWVGQWAFKNCRALTQIALSPSMTNYEFNKGAFADSGLTNVTIPTSVNAIPESAFAGCSALTTVNAHFRITTINRRAFYGCTSLTDFEIPGWVGYIGESAFANSGLGDVSLNDDIEYVAPGAFAGCTNMKNITVSSYGQKYRSANGVLYCNEGNAYCWILHTYPAGRTGAVEVPYDAFSNAGAIYKIGQYAFAGCRGITGITLPSQCTTIGSCAFKDCINLTSFRSKATYAGAGSISMGNLAFAGCTALKSINLPDPMTEIPNGLFSGCTGLKQVGIPNRITRIDSTAFLDCTLEEIFYGGTQYQWSPLGSSIPNVANILTHYNVASSTNHWRTESKDPTCLDAGYSKDTCNCGYTRNEVTKPATGIHVYDRKRTTVEYKLSDATCTSKAVYFLSCACGEKGTQTFEAGSFDLSNHNFVADVCDCSAVRISENTFPDTKFRAWILEQSYGDDGVLTEVELATVTTINVDSKNIADLAGIEYFTALTVLWLDFNQLTSLDVSKNTALTDLGCLGNQLTSLDVSKNTALTALRCPGNQLSTLDISKNTALTHLTCNENQLTSLDVSKNTALTSLSCSDNQLTSLDVSKNTALKELVCSGNQLTALDVSKNTSLVDFYCHNNRLTALDVSKNTALMHLVCSENQLTVLNVSKNTVLVSLSCYENQLTSLDVSKNTALTELYCADNQLTTLDVSKNAALTDLGCFNNQLTSLDVSGCTSLVNLYCALNSRTVSAVQNKFDLGNLAADGFDISKASNWVGGTVNGNILTATAETVTYTYELGNDTTETFTLSIDGLCSHVGGTCGDPNVDDGKNVTWEFDETTGTLTIFGTGAMANFSSAVSQPWNAYQPAIKTVVISNGVTSIGDFAWSGCSILTSVSIPDSVTRIGVAAFQMCSCLTSIYIPENVTRLESYTFYGCSNLTDVYITDIGAWANIYASGLYDHPLSCNFNEKRLFLNGELLEDLVIPDGITKIGNFAFFECGNLKSVTLPTSITQFGNNTFGQNSSLTDVYISDLAAWVALDQHPMMSNQNMRLFLNNTLIADLVIPSGVTKIGGSSFRGCSSIRNVSLPDTLTKIEYSAFLGCTGLSSIIIPDSVSVLEENIFTNCSNLTSVKLPSSLTNIFDFTFQNCTNLKDIQIPDKVAGIYYAAFSGCKSLTSITLPGSLTFLGDASFYNCTSLSEITFKGNAPTFQYDPTMEGTDYITFHNVKAMVNYPADDTWTDSVRKQYGGDLTWEPYYTGICGENLTWKLDGNGTLTISGNGPMCAIVGKESQPWYSVSDKIKKVIVENGVTSISQEAFMDCDNLEEAVIADSVLAMASHVFDSCGKLNKVDLPNALKMVEMRTFAECTSLTTLMLPETVKVIGSQSFEHSGLSEITIPKSVEMIGGLAFTDCTNLKTVYFESDPPKIHIGDEGQAGSFNNCIITAYYPAGNAKWTEDVMQDYDGKITWICVDCKDGHTETTVTGTPATCTQDGLSDGKICSVCKTVILKQEVIPAGHSVVNGICTKCKVYGTCGDNLTWVLDDGGTLTIFGDGYMDSCLDNAPWKNWLSQITDLVVMEGVQGIGNGALENALNLENVTFGLGIDYIGVSAFANCTSLTHITLPEGLTEICNGTFSGSGLRTIIIPDHVTDIGYKAFSECNELANITFTGRAPSIAADAFTGITANAYYPAGDSTWTDDVTQNYGGTITWIAGLPEEKIDGILHLQEATLSNETTVWIDGIPYPVQKDNSGKAYVELPEGAEVSSMVTYGFHVGDPNDVHTQYPVSMKVWVLKKDENGIYQAHYVKELDNILQYSGSSIRITGNKGIRMITSVESNKKSAMTGAGLAGYKLLEYGTVLAQSSKMTGPLTLGQSYARSNYAYKRGVADPVFAYSGNLVQYTNVLVGFNMDQCAEDIAMRPYMILEDAEGKQVTIYGGTVYRSIGYIAYQNRGVFAPGSAAYNYVWEIIHHVYGDQYDKDYKG